MNAGTLGFALAAGLVAALNPCGFSMLPAYLTLVVLGGAGGGGAGEDANRPGRAAALGRALVATAAMTAGFLLVFGTFGLLVAPLAAVLQAWLPWVTVLIGVGVLALGGWMAAGRELTLLLPRPGRGAPTARLGSLLGYGVAYALASLSCTIGPFLAVTATTFATGSVLDGVLAFLAYGAGMAVLVGVLAGATALVGDAVAVRARRLLPRINRIGGVLLILVGLYVGYYGLYELRLESGAGPDDPVVAAAGDLQQAIAGAVAAVGWTPPLVGLVLLVVIVAVVGRRGRSARKGRG